MASLHSLGPTPARTPSPGSQQGRGRVLLHPVERGNALPPVGGDHNATAAAAAAAAAAPAAPAKSASPAPSGDEDGDEYETDDEAVNDGDLETGAGGTDGGTGRSARGGGGGFNAAAAHAHATAVAPARPSSGKANGKMSRVHPMPNSGTSLIAGTASGRGLGSVFAGAPDENVALSPRSAAAAALVASSGGSAGEDVDDEDLQDAKVARSAFHRQRTIIAGEDQSQHRMELVVATFNLMVHMASILTDLLLLADYSEHDQNVSAGAIAVVRILVGLVEIEFDYLNNGWQRGRWALIPVTFCNCKIVVDYVRYVRSWRRHRGKPWRNSDFRANASFETFIGSLPILIVQTYVWISDPRPTQDVWVVAYCMTLLSASLDLLHHFKYVAVGTSIYVAQFTKALVASGLRTVIVAILLDKIGRVILAWAVVSFLFGAAVYYAAVRYSRAQGRDDPFKYGALFHHICFGGLVAGTQLFVSVPFAPSHSIYDWWLGYLLCEVKQGVENFCILAVVLTAVYGDYAHDVFYSVFALVAVCFVGNLVACWFIHLHVRKMLHARNAYSDTAIVRMFATFLDYFKRAWYPQSILQMGSAQNHLLYRDEQGNVPQNLRAQHDKHLARAESINADIATNPLAPKHSPKNSMDLEAHAATKL